MKANTGYSIAPNKFRYIFKEMSHPYVKDEETGRSFRIDKAVMETHNLETLRNICQKLKRDKINVNDWEVIHLDGDINNNRLDNLEYLFFTEGDPILDKADNLKDKVRKLENEIKQLKKECKEYKDKITLAKRREEISNEKVAYIKKVNEELNKEILKKENEANRYWHLLNDKNKD